MTDSIFTIYGDMLSGNCYKIKLLCQFLQLKHQWLHVDILARETQQAEFLAKNPNGKIPLLVTASGSYLTESNAILNYLAAGSPLLPSDNFLHAQVLQWQFFEQYSHEPYIAVARYINTYLGLPADRHAEYNSKQEGGNKALTIMNTHLATANYFVGDQLTIADISLYAYTHVGEEDGFELSRYPYIQQWLKRIESTQGYITMMRDNA